MQRAIKTSKIAQYKGANTSANYVANYIIS